MKKAELRAGQSVWVHSRRGNSFSFEEERIKKIGREYFYLEGSKWDRTKFSIETLREVSEYTTSIAIYLDPQEYYDSVESDKLFIEIKDRFFRSYQNKIPLEKLREIKKILEQ